jgi:hypothetical protein
MSYSCPNCKRPLYNRRFVRCGYCNFEIPEEQRFSPEEIAAIDKQVAEEDERLEKRRLEQRLRKLEEDVARAKAMLGVTSYLP